MSDDESIAAPVVVTGAAGGIGRAVVGSFLAVGCPVVGLDVDVHVEEVSDAPRYRGLRVDVTCPQALAAAAAEVGAVQHLVTVAGGACAEEIDGWLVDPEVWSRSLAVNLSSAYFCVHAFTPGLLRAGLDRSVTFTSSINAVQGFGLTAYSAAKAGLGGLLHALLSPLGSAGVRVNSVLPGTVVTPRALAEWSGSPGHFERMVAGVPLGRLAEPADVARVVQALALSLTHVHGAEVVVDGGQSKFRT